MASAIALFHRTIASMNSSLDMVFTGTNHEIAEQVTGLIEKDALSLEKLLSRFDPEAETFRLNQSACGRWETVSERLWEILQECEHYNCLTAGYFNVALGAFKRDGERYLASSGERESGNFMPAVTFDHGRKAIRLEHGASLDFGAVGKGLLLREVQKRLNWFGVNSGLVSFGGSSVLTKGTHPHGGSWPVSWRDGISNPTVFHLNDTCASFSGATQLNHRCFKPHIIHPKKLQLVKNERLVFVQDNCPVLAEVLSTALIVADKNDFSELITKLTPESVNVFKRTDHNELLTMYNYESKN